MGVTISVQDSGIVGRKRRKAPEITFRSPKIMAESEVLEISARHFQCQRMD